MSGGGTSSGRGLTRTSRHRSDDGGGDESRTPQHGESSQSFVNRMCSYLTISSSRPINVKEQTVKMANFAVQFSIRKNKLVNSSKTEECLARCILKMHSKHSMVFGGMMLRLNVNTNIDFYQGFLEVSEELFCEDISWSKIVALYAFAARLAQFCVEHSLDNLLSNLTDSLIRFSLEYLSSFLQSEGGWDRLCEVFPAENEVEVQVWKCLGVAAIGLATCSLILAARRYAVLHP